MQQTSLKPDETPSNISEESLRTFHTALYTLAVHLPEVNKLLDESFSSISEQFVQTANLLSEYGELVKNPSLTAAEIEKRDYLHNQMGMLITKTIMDMQFQDRVSQNLVIAINVVKEIAKDIEEEVSLSGKLDASLTQRLVYLLNLGEIRHKFITHAKDMGAMDTPEDYGIHDANVEHKAPDGDDIDLF